MRKLAFALLTALAAGLFSGLVALSGLPCAEANAQSPASRDFAASYESVKTAAADVARRIDIEIRGTEDTPERFQIRFERSVGTFSRGEMGEINVFPVDDQTTRVLVTIYKLRRRQVVVTTEWELTESIFANIALLVDRPSCRRLLHLSDGGDGKYPDNSDYHR